MKTFYIILCIVNLISFIGLLINPEAWANIFYVLYFFTMIMLIALGIILLSISDNESDFDCHLDKLTSHHPFVKWLRRHHGVN